LSFAPRDTGKRTQNFVNRKTTRRAQLLKQSHLVDSHKKKSTSIVCAFSNRVFNQHKFMHLPEIASGTEETSKLNFQSEEI